MKEVDGKRAARGQRDQRVKKRVERGSRLSQKFKGQTNFPQQISETGLQCAQSKARDDSSSCLQICAWNEFKKASTLSMTQILWKESQNISVHCEWEEVIESFPSDVHFVFFWEAWLGDSFSLLCALTQRHRWHKHHSSQHADPL